MAGRQRVYNRTYSPEEWELVNQKNKDVMDDFLEEYKQRKLKKGTIDSYFQDLRIIMIYVKNFCGNKCVLELGKKDFRRLSIWLSEDLQLSSARVNRMMSATRSMLSYCEDDDETEYENNVARKVKGLPKEPVKTNEEDFFMTYDQVMRVREELLKRGKIQLCLLHMLLFDSGGRRNEVYQVKKQDMVEGNKTNTVVGKRGKVFPLVFLNDTRELARQFFEKRGIDKIDSLWVVGKGENARKVTYNTLYSRVVAISEILSELEGREINIFPHSYRHSRTECLLQGQDPRIIDVATGKPKKFTLEEVQLFLHHSDPKTTQGYAKDHSEEIIDTMFNFDDKEIDEDAEEIQ
ncbi:MAG: site-specific integrase [Tissierellia bacterium]|nr:site-specific integrase [Tissierellia bacterium]